MVTHQALHPCQETAPLARCLAVPTQRLYKPTSAAGGVEPFLWGHNQGLDNLMIQIQLPMVRFLCHRVQPRTRLEGRRVLRCWGEGGEMHGLGVAGGNLCPLFPWVETSTLSPGEICGHLTPIGILFPQHAHLGLNQQGKKY